MVGAEDFPSFLRSRLPQGNEIRVYHISTSPNPCPPLFAPGPGRSEHATTLESHFLTLSQSHKHQHPHAPVSADHLSDLLVLGIEVLIFVTADSTAVFVSKADSTGLLQKPAGVVSHGTSLAQTVITAFLDFILEPHLDRGRVVLSLFARAQNQYLFPGSIENVTKHVLDDRQLIKWWCKVLDPLARRAKTDVLQSVRAHVVVPGCDGSETKAFFPASTRADSPSSPIWSNSYPVSLLVQDTSLPPRCLVPRLPDDPKSRFLEDLDAHRDEDGSWRGIKSLDQFWEMMSYRQECSAGRLVGFVWIVFTPVAASRVTNGGGVSDETILHQNGQRPTEDGSMRESGIATAGAATSATASPSLTNGISNTSVLISSIATELTASPPAPSVQERAVTQTEPLSDETLAKDLTVRSSQDHVQTTEVVTATGSDPPAQLVLSSEDYQVLMDDLLALDFAGQQLAIESTQTWRQKAMDLAHGSRFGVEVSGTASYSKVSTVTTNDTSPKTVNVLTGLRKKRKAEPADAITGDTKTERPTVNTLATNLVRKKPKP